MIVLLLPSSGLIVKIFIGIFVLLFN